MTVRSEKWCALTLAAGAAVLSMFGGSSQVSAQTMGPSSWAAPYLVPAGSGTPLQAYSILTAGDTVGTYTMVGVPDGMGAYDNGNQTMTILVNHELGAASGVTRARGGPGAFVSRWVVNTAPGPDFLKVISGMDLDQSVVTNSVGGGSTLSFARFCSADLAPVTAFFNAASGNGTDKRIYLNGEENGNAGRVMAHVVDVNGANTGVGFQLNAFDNLGAWENVLAHPNLGDKTLIMANSDGGTKNGVYAYLGTKTNTGTDIQKAGLTNGTTYGIKVSVGSVAIASENRQFGFATSGSPVLNGRFDLTTNNSETTTFLRPEDGAWDPVHPNDYYFVTTDQYDQAKDGVGSTVGRTRLWRMRYDNVSNPTAGGSIEALLDGTEATQMLDNIAVVPGLDGHTRIMAVEDVGGNAHNGKVLLYDADTDTLDLIGKHFANNGDIGVAAFGQDAYSHNFNNDEEFSGIIDARNVLGPGWFLTVDQQHFGFAGQVVEGGQIMAFYAPNAVPEPASVATLALSAMALSARRRRRA